MNGSSDLQTGRSPKTVITAIAVFAAALFAVLIPKTMIQSLESPWMCGGRPAEEDPITLASVHFDHPLQRMLTMKIAVTDLGDDRAEVTVYTFFGIPFGVIT